MLYAERIASQQDRVEDAIEIYQAVARDAEGLLGAIATTRAELLKSIRPYGLAKDTRGFERAIKQMSDLTPLVARPSFPSTMREDESRIFELLSHDRPLFLGEIQFQCRMTPSTTLDALRALVSQGFVSKIEVGAARVPAYQSNVDWIENVGT